MYIKTTDNSRSIQEKLDILIKENDLLLEQQQRLLRENQQMELEHFEKSEQGELYPYITFNLLFIN